VLRGVWLVRSTPELADYTDTQALPPPLPLSSLLRLAVNNSLFD